MGIQLNKTDLHDKLRQTVLENRRTADVIFMTRKHSHFRFYIHHDQVKVARYSFQKIKL